MLLCHCVNNYERLGPHDQGTQLFFTSTALNILEPFVPKGKKKLRPSETPGTTYPGHSVTSQRTGISSNFGQDVKYRNPVSVKK